MSSYILPGMLHLGRGLVVTTLPTVGAYVAGAAVVGAVASNWDDVTDWLEDRWFDLEMFFA